MTEIIYVFVGILGKLEQILIIVHMSMKFKKPVQSVLVTVLNQSMDADIQSS